MEPSVLVIVITCDGRKWLPACLDSLRLTSGIPYELLIVDNASKDETISYLESLVPPVEIVKNNVNVGFAEACNIGLRLALRKGVKYIALLNQDIKVDRSWLKEAVDVLEKDERIGILSPLQYTYGGPEVDPACKEIMANGDEVFPGFLETGNVIGAAMILTGVLCRQIGGFDPDYFCYGEETDLCQRAVDRGFRVGVALKSAVFHWHSRLDKNNFSSSKSDAVARNRFICILKNPKRPLWLNWAGYFLWHFTEMIKERGPINGTLECFRLLPQRIADMKQLPGIARKRLCEKKNAPYLFKDAEP